MEDIEETFFFSALLYLNQDEMYVYVYTCAHNASTKR